jgi:hypothetical protein
VNAYLIATLVLCVGCPRTLGQVTSDALSSPRLPYSTERQEGARVRYTGKHASPNKSIPTTSMSAQPPVTYLQVSGQSEAMRDSMGGASGTSGTSGASESSVDDSSVDSQGAVFKVVVLGDRTSFLLPVCVCVCRCRCRCRCRCEL